jgi:hypothetical protein
VNRHIAAQTALGRVGLPDDIGDAIAALLSNERGSEEHPSRDFHTLRVHPRQLIAEQGGDGVADRGYR